MLSARAAALVSGCVYPVPDPRFPFLGVHFTRRIDGSVWAGPNAVPVFGRRLASPGDAAARRAATGAPGAGELWRAASRRAALRDMRRYLPDLELADLERGPPACAPRSSTATGRLVDDFVIDQAPGVLHVVNAPSPAATASLAIAAHVVDRLPG